MNQQQGRPRQRDGGGQGAEGEQALHGCWGAGVRCCGDRGGPCVGKCGGWASTVERAGAEPQVTHCAWSLARGPWCGVRPRPWERGPQNRIREGSWPWLLAAAQGVGGLPGLNDHCSNQFLHLHASLQPIHNRIPKGAPAVCNPP